MIYVDLDDEVFIRCEFVDNGLGHIDPWFPFTHSTTRVFSFNIYNTNRFIKCYGFSLLCMNTGNFAHDFVELVFNVKEILAFRAINQTPFAVDSIQFFRVNSRSFLLPFLPPLKTVHALFLP